MKKFLSILLTIATLTLHAQTGAYNEQARAYIRQYKDWAIEEQQRTGVPAAITLAQGIHETQAGTSELATEANNHFGIKCKKNWTGETFTHTDDAPDECFRKYAKAYDSYRDHSDYLRQTPRYGHCFEQDVTDYAAWARELKAAGYATNPRYAQKLINIVEDFQLQDYTYAAMKAPQPQGERLGQVTEKVPTNIRYEDRRKERDIPVQQEEKPIPTQPSEVVAAPVIAPAVEEYTEPTPVYGQAALRNNLKGFYAHKGDVLLESAIKYNMRYAKLLELNDLPDAPLEADMFIYTEKKRGLGLRRQHTVKQGETMQQVAQAEGVQLKQLRNLNGMLEGDEPATDVVLNLQTPTNTKPALRIRSERTNIASRQAPARESEMIDTGHPAVVKEEEEEDTAPKAIAESAPKAITATPQPVMVNNDPPAAKRDAAQIPTEEVPMPVTKPTSVVVHQEPKRTPPPPAPPKQKTYTIADEMAIGEEAPKYSPRYNATTTPAATENSTSTTTKEEPQDDFSRLKARLDKAVYATPAKPVATNQPLPQPRPAATTVTALPAAAPQAASGDNNTPVYHFVKTGETAYGIAKENNLTMKQLMQLNNLNFEAIKVGQKLRVK